MEFLNSVVGNNAMIFSAVILILAYIFIAERQLKLKGFVVKYENHKKC